MLAELASVSPSFTRYLYGREGQGTQAGQGEVKGSTPCTRTSYISTYSAPEKRGRGTREYAAECEWITAVINGVELYPTGDNGSVISRIRWAAFVTLGMPYEEELDWTMAGITGYSVPLSCYIHKDPVSIGGELVYTAIFVAPGEEGELVLRRPFEQEARLQWDSRADGSMWRMVT